MSEKIMNHELDNEAASRILSNVLKQSHKKETGIPLEVLASYTEYKMPYEALRYVLLGALLLVLSALPFFATPPRFTVEEVSRELNGIATYEVDIDNVYPVKSVEATLDGKKISAIEDDKGYHFVTPSSEGKLVITVTLTNGQYRTYEKMIGGIDLDPPKFIRIENKGKTARIFVEDAGSGIDYDNAFAVDIDGNVIKPVHHGYGYIDFTIKAGSNIYINDRVGNTLHLIAAN